MNDEATKVPTTLEESRVTSDLHEGEVVLDLGSGGIRALYLRTTIAERCFPSFGFRAITRDVVLGDIRATQECQSACPASATVMCRDCTPA